MDYLSTSDMAKIFPFDLNRTLEQLEKDNWGEEVNSTYLITTCLALRKKPLKDFNAEDLRIMIGQNISLDHLIPMAIETLKKDILVSGRYNKGDLLTQVLKRDSTFWAKNRKLWQAMIQLFEDNQTILKESESDEVEKEKWFQYYEKLKAIKVLNQKLLDRKNKKNTLK